MKNKLEVDLRKLLHGELEYTEFSEEELRYRRVPDFSYCVLNELETLYTPVIDHAHLEGDCNQPEWPGDAEFAVCLTHDIDNVSKHNPRHDLRRGITRARSKLQQPVSDDYLSGIGPLSAAKSLAGGVASATRDSLRQNDDPLHCFERWLEIEDEFDAHSTFFFLPEDTETPHASDPKYRYSDQVTFDGKHYTVGEMASAIDDRGWEIGLHPSWYAYDDADKLSRQKKKLEAQVGSKVKSVRQHYLHYDPRRTPEAHDEAGFMFDSTLGFNRNVGFRRGTSYPWRQRDITGDEELEITEIPLTIQDIALLRDDCLALDVDAALDYIELLADRVQETGGVLTLSWHARSLADEDAMWLYRRTLEKIADRDVWFGSVAEIGECWRQQDVEVKL